MGKRKKSVVRLFAATALLFAVSAYRQLSMRYLPEDALRSYLVWVVYMLLLFGWQYTISTKITQKTMRSHLTAQNIVSILYLTVRFVQDAFLYVNIPWMRFTGYFINIAAIFIPLFILSWQGRRLSDQQKVVSASDSGVPFKRTGADE